MRVSALWRVLARHRRAVILAVVLLAAFLLMTVQVRHDRAVVSLVRQAVLFTASPFIKLTAVTAGSVSHVWQNYVDLRGLRQENLRLQREAGILQRRIDQLEEQVLETQRLQGLLAMRETWRADFLAARVVGKDATNWFKSILLDRGSLDGVRRNMPAVTADGLVGRVVDVTPTASRVQLLTDPVSSVGGLVQRTRVTGIVSGNLGAGTRVRYLPLLADVVAGDEVVTSGMGGVFPKGIPVGRITAVERKSGALFAEAALAPAADLGRLEEVMILTGTEPRRGFETGSRQ
jgi:rod shape-determining protein MreC